MDTIKQRDIWDDADAYVQAVLDTLGIPWNTDIDKVKQVLQGLTRETTDL